MSTTQTPNSGRARLGFATSFILAVITMLPGLALAEAHSDIYLDSPDPHITYVDGTYYLYTTQFYRFRTPLWTSTDSLNWEFQGDARPFQPEWASGPSWGPSVVELASNSFIMYYSAIDITTTPYRRCVGVATSSSPAGPFVEAGTEPIVCDRDVGGQIDPYAFIDSDGSLYLIYKDDMDQVGGLARLRSQRLTADGLATVGDPTTLLTGQSGWEGNYVENPAMFRLDGSLYLAYSANAWESEDYATGYAICDTAMGPCVRPQPGQPLLGSIPGRIGPGGATVVTGTPAGSLISYQVWENGTGYGQGGSRISKVEELVAEWGFLRLADSPALATDTDCQSATASSVTGYQSTASSRSIYRLYCAYFLREPDADGYAYWLGVVNGGAHLATVSDEFAVSLEFDLTYGNLTNPEFVTQLYLNTMRRQPDPEGHAYWLAMLDGSVLTRGEVVLQFSDSAEFRALTGTY